MFSRAGAVRALTLVLVLMLVASAALGAAAPLVAADRQLETTSQRPEVPAWLAPLLPEQGHRVVDGGVTEADFWLRQQLPQRASSGELGVDFGSLPDGALVGVVVFGVTWSDYRKQPIAPGVYTMRYGVQPADGDHTGQTYFRDFLMLVPVAEDTFPEEGGVEQATIVEASKKASGKDHPAVLALYQIYDPVDGISLVANDYGEPCLAVPIGGVVMGLVLEGWGSGLQL